MPEEATDNGQAERQRAGLAQLQVEAAQQRAEAQFKLSNWRSLAEVGRKSILYDQL